MIKFTTQTLYEIIRTITSELKNKKAKDIYEFEVLNPDSFSSLYAGKEVIINNDIYIYRGYKVWTDLAQKLFCRMLTPILASNSCVVIRFQKIDTEDSFHKLKIEKEEKYGERSTFFEINKNEEPEILMTYLQALENVKIGEKKRVLNLGINKAEEYEIIKDVYSNFEDIEFVGIDYCESAIDFAENKFKEKGNVKFYSHDINKLSELDIGKFDLIISIGTLQSSNLDFNKTFMNIVQNYLTSDGSMILGFPNCRWIDGEIIYGAKAPNYPFSEMSILYKDAFFCKKYLQQKKFRVTLTGKYYIFLTATSIRK